MYKFLSYGLPRDAHHACSVYAHTHERGALEGSYRILAGWSGRHLRPASRLDSYNLPNSNPMVLDRELPNGFNCYLTYERDIKYLIVVDRTKLIPFGFRQIALVNMVANLTRRQQPHAQEL